MRTNAIALAAVLSALVVQQASAQSSIQVSQPGDANLSCGELTAEIARMDQIASQAQTQGANAQANVASTGAIASAATSAALYSGALGRSLGGFGGLFASGAQNALSAKQNQDAQQTASLSQDAQMRRTMLTGIYQGKACDKAQSATAATPVSAPATPSAAEPPPSYAPAGAPSYRPAGAEAPGG
jgi:predicted extracellular nuclease